LSNLRNLAIILSFAIPEEILQLSYLLPYLRKLGNNSIFCHMVTWGNFAIILSFATLADIIFRVADIVVIAAVLKITIFLHLKNKLSFLFNNQHIY
jgi:hypothetical protein